MVGRILCRCGRSVPTTGDWLHAVRRNDANTMWIVRCYGWCVLAVMFLLGVSAGAMLTVAMFVL